MKIYFTFIFVLLSNLCFSQKEDYVWFLGKDQSLDVGIQAMKIDWNNQSDPLVETIGMGVDNNNASISDKDGNLLFWSNGCAVINKDQEVMPNGDTLNWDPWREILGWTDCTHGYPGKQNIKIIPDPGQEDGFYIFHKTIKYNGQFEPSTSELRISYVDMALEYGNGDLTYFDSVLFENPVTFSNLELVYAADGINWWVLQPMENDSSILTYYVSDLGIQKMPDQNSNLFFQKYRSNAGTMRISPDGTKMAYYEYFQNLHVYDFDRTTGLISNHKKVIIFDDSEEKPDNQFRFGSVEWSPNSRFMYVAVRDSLFQVDSWEEDMNDGIQLIDIYDGILDPFPNPFYIAALAPDCKIYICSGSGNKSYHVINEPNELGTDCDFKQRGLKLPQNAGSANLPLFPRFRVDEQEKCDPTITSVFGNAVFYRRDLTVFPNPSNGIVNIEIPSQWSGGNLIIFDNLGKICYQQEINFSDFSVELNLRHFSNGIYNVELYPTKNEKRVFYGKQIVISK